MNLHHLRIFYTVAQRRSVTAAAADLLLSQPAVSLQLKALEKELGLPLFQRGGSKLRLTQAGEVLYRAAVSMLHAKEEAERAITELRDGTRGRLIFGAGTTGGMYVLPRIVQAYKGLWPETDILFHVGTTDQILDKLLQNVLDMGLMGGPIEDRRFLVEPICADELVLIAAPSHPIAALAKVTLKDLGGMPFIVPEAGSNCMALGKIWLYTAHDVHDADAHPVTIGFTHCGHCSTATLTVPPLCTVPPPLGDSFPPPPPPPHAAAATASTPTRASTRT